MGAEIRVPQEMVGARCLLVEAHYKDRVIQAAFIEGLRTHCRQIPRKESSINSNFVGFEALIEFI